MPEFKKKKRFLKYQDSDCKKFLSRDFLKQCGYCRIREGDLGGPDNFEKDHFVPISKHGSDDYENLIYSCRQCNGRNGKSDNWSETLLRPDKDLIWNKHVKIAANYHCEKITELGKEYISTLKLNRKSYIRRRKKIAEKQKELREKINEYKMLCQLLLDVDTASGTRKIIENDITESEKMLEYGVNYRMSEIAFDEDIEKKIYDCLCVIGTVEYVDKDYDLMYEVIIDYQKYLCNVEITTWDFEKSDTIKKYISVEKLQVWKEINESNKIMMLIYNKQDSKIYAVKLDRILQSGSINNQVRCAYEIYKEDCLI